MHDRYIAHALRQAVFERDGYTCQYCGCSGDEVNLEIDHVIPVSRGGVSDIRNLVTACEACNRSKSDKLISHEALQELAGLINSSAEYLEGLITDGGRRHKQGNADRVQVSVYLDRNTYEIVKDIAAFSGDTLSDIIARLAEGFAQKNAGELERLRQTIRGTKFNYE